MISPTHIAVRSSRPSTAAAAVNPATMANIYYWHETAALGLANNATLNSFPDQSAAGNTLGSGANFTYKTNILNGYGVVDNTATAAVALMATTALASQTIVMIQKCSSAVDTNDVWNNSAVATRLRMASPGYDYYANSASGVQAVGGTTLLSWDTVVIRVAASGGNMVIRVNGVQKASFVPHPNFYGNQIMRMMASMSGQWAVFGRYNTDIGDTNCQSIESYLRTKYNHY